MRVLIFTCLLLALANAQTVGPMDCGKYYGPMQVLENDENSEVEVRFLNLKDDEENSYDLVYVVPDNKCSRINGCGVHPFDKVVYCFCRGGGNAPHRIVRFDEFEVEYVMDVTDHSYTADFADDGTFYAISQNKDLYRYDNINSASPIETFLYSTTFLPSDIAVTEADYIGDGTLRSYAVGMNSRKIMHIFPLAEDCYGGDCHYILYARGSGENIGTSGATYGAAYSFGPDLFFSDNFGVGIYRLTIDPIDSYTIDMEYVTESAVTFKNDGLYCRTEAVWPPLPSATPTTSPSLSPTHAPVTSAQPSTAPVTSAQPSAAPTTTYQPSAAPTTTSQPSAAPTTTAQPSAAPTTTSQPSAAPVTSAQPSTSPVTSAQPSAAPTTTSQPSAAPTTTSQPSAAPTTTSQPSAAPTTTSQPSAAPVTSAQPSTAPVTSAQPSASPTTTSQPSAAPTTTSQPSAAPVTSAQPSAVPTETVVAVDCGIYAGPMQILEANGQYELRILELGEGGENTFELIYTVPENDCKVINACGLHPVDHVVYCQCHKKNSYSMIKFDDKDIETVMSVSEKSFSGSFDVDGNFYYLSKGSTMYKISGINGDSPTEERLYHHTAGYNPFDIVITEIDRLGDGNSKRYAVGMRNQNKVFLFPLAVGCYGMEGCFDQVFATGDVGQSSAVYGAAYVFDSEVYVSDNDGVGIYRLDFVEHGGSKVDVEMSFVADSEQTYKNDGLYCSNSINVFATDCEGSWSECTNACETAAERSWTQTVAPSGTGSECPAAEDCAIGMGECVACICAGEISSMDWRCTPLTTQGDCESEGVSFFSDGVCDWSCTHVDCEGSFSACTTACETAAQRSWSQTKPAQGIGAECPAATDCTFGEDACCNPDEYTIIHSGKKRCSGFPSSKWNNLGTVSSVTACAQACLAIDCQYAAYNEVTQKCTEFDSCDSFTKSSEAFTLMAMNDYVCENTCNPDNFTILRSNEKVRCSGLPEFGTGGWNNLGDHANATECGDACFALEDCSYAIYNEAQGKCTSFKSCNGFKSASVKYTSMAMNANVCR